MLSHSIEADNQKDVLMEYRTMSITFVCVLLPCGVLIML